MIFFTQFYVFFFLFFSPGRITFHQLYFQSFSYSFFQFFPLLERLHLFYFSFYFLLLQIFSKSLFPKFSHFFYLSLRIFYLCIVTFYFLSFLLFSLLSFFTLTYSTFNFRLRQDSLHLLCYKFFVLLPFHASNFFLTTFILTLL